MSNVAYHAGIVLVIEQVFKIFNIPIGYLLVFLINENIKKPFEVHNI